MSSTDNPVLRRIKNMFTGKLKFIKLNILSQKFNLKKCMISSGSNTGLALGEKSNIYYFLLMR